MKCAIYGAGSLGTILGAFLTKGGVEVDLVNRNKAHTDALKKNGASVTGTVTMTVPVNALLPEEMTARYDVIFLLTKQTENRTVAEALKAHLADGGVVCTLQNGLPETLLAEILGGERRAGLRRRVGRHTPVARRVGADLRDGLPDLFVRQPHKALG